MEFRNFFEHCHSLSFEDKPNYDYLYNLFGKLSLQEGFQIDTALELDVAGGQNQQGYADKSRAIQDKRDCSPKRRTR